MTKKFDMKRNNNRTQQKIFSVLSGLPTLNTIDSKIYQSSDKFKYREEFFDV